MNVDLKTITYYQLQIIQFQYFKIKNLINVSLSCQFAVVPETFYFSL